MTRTFLYSTAALAAALACRPAAAQTAPEPDAAGRAAAAPAVAEVVVTAARAPQAPERVGQSVTVLTEAEIDASQAVLVTDLLARTPGVTVNSNGGAGALTSLRIRGAEADQTLVVVDGVKLNDPSLVGGGFNFGNLLVGDVSRLEVLRGPQSTLWGGQAIGGVVSIVTAEPDEPFEANVDAEVGSRDTAYVRAGAGGASDRIVWRVAGGYYTTAGVSAAASGSEADGYRNYGLSGRARVALTDVLSLDVRAVWSDGETDFDGFAPPTFALGDTRESGTTREFVGYAGLNADLLDGRFRSRVAYGYTDTDRENRNPAQTPNAVSFEGVGRNERWEYQGTFALTQGWTAVFGAEREDSAFRTRSPSSFSPNPPIARAETGIDSLYAQLQGEVIEGLTVTAGLRRDSHDAFGDHVLGQAAVAWALNGGDTVLRASFGQGFKAPSLYQLYSEYGNAGLQPEEADGWDAGVEQKLFNGSALVSATLFKRETDNQIDFFSCAVGPDPLCTGAGGLPRFGYYNNIARSEAQGLELAGTAAVGALSVEANYTFTETENLSGSNRGRILPRRPEHQANAAATYLWARQLSTTVALRFVGDSFDDAANRNRIRDFTLVDLRAAWPMTETVELYARIENLFDRAYQTSLNYGQPGRGGFVGLRARF
jgi:vitamin B12 transporter